MSTWRYKARDTRTLEIRTSVIQAESDTSAREALRRAGLSPIMIKPIRAKRENTASRDRFFDRHFRARRVHLKADFYDSLSILLDAGIPIALALRTMGQSHSDRNRIGQLALMLGDVIREGESLGNAMREHPRWFDEAEIAMIDAGQRSGEMCSILRRLAERQSRAGELSSKLIGALAYPLLVSVIGVGVTLFLSVKTLPELVGILEDADVQPPGLTLAVMHLGQFVWHNGSLMVLGAALIIFAMMILNKALAEHHRQLLQQCVARCSPRVFRKTKSAETMLSLAEMLDTGVSLVESVRVVVPTMRGVLGGLLGRSLAKAAGRIEQGEPIGCLFEDPLWFSEEHRQLMLAGETAGELSTTLARIGELDLRAARRLLDRFASMLEPAAILLLAVLVGTVVMSAVLPLIRLQEIVG
ncbi:MAG: hypothetical protein CMJ35_11685 [Phycisphaerae bacterium]|nr:hypothetical protein [Phycisphaerae bacterium]